MTLTFNEEIALQAAFMHIKRERRESLQAMFSGTQLIPKSRVEDAKTLAKSAKDCVKDLVTVPGVTIPDLKVPKLNTDLFKDLDLRKLLNIPRPLPQLPGFNLGWIKNIELGEIPGFNLPKVRLNLKGILKFKELLEDIHLDILVYSIVIKFPDLSIPSLLLDLSKILDIDFDVVFPDLRLRIPEFFIVDMNISLPHLSLPDVNFPSLPSIDLPSVDLSKITIDIGGIDFPTLLKIPGFGKVIRLLFELFDVVDINIIIAELGAEFLADFISSALPVVSQIKGGSKIAVSLGKAAVDWHKAGKTTIQSEYLVKGDARQACTALRTLLTNSRDEHLTTAAIQTAQLATSTAALFADLGVVSGPVIAAAGAVATTCQKIMIMGARYKEVRNVNRILNAPGGSIILSANIFEVSPLLGCYYLANNTTSSVLNVLCDNIIEDGWMTDWENNKRNYLDPLIRECQRFIMESRYVLTPLKQNTGMYVERTTMEKLKEGVSLYIKKKRGLAPAHATVSRSKYIGS